MTEKEHAIWMLDASMFQLRSGAASIEDAMTAMPLRLAIDVLAGAIASARDQVTPAAVNSIAFAMNDVEAGAGELSAPDFQLVAEPLATLNKDLESLKATSALPATLIESVRDFQSKLKERRNAIERQTMVEGGGGALPHAPQDLRAAAVAFRDQLSAAGFETPVLDGFIEDPSSLRFHTINEINDELDVIVG
jgi:hypothetical protein